MSEYSYGGRKPAKWTLFLRVGGTLLSLALIVYLVSDQGWEELLLALRTIGWRPFLLSLAYFLISRLAVSGRWYSLLRGVSPEISPLSTFKVTFAGLFAANFLPTTIGGDLLRFAGGLQMKLDSAVVAASLIVDRLIGMLGMALMLPFFLPEFLGPMGGGVRHLLQDQTRQDNSPQAIIAIIGTWTQAAGKFLRKLVSALKTWAARPGYLALSLVFTFIHMGMLFLAIQNLLSGLGERLTVLEIGPLWSLVYFLTLVPVSINGLGLQEISFTYIFTSLGGLTLPHAITLAVLIRTLSWLASLPGVVFLPPILGNLSVIRRRSSPGADLTELVGYQDSHHE